MIWLVFPNERGDLKSAGRRSTSAPGTQNEQIFDPPADNLKVIGLWPPGTLFGGCRLCQTSPVTRNTSEI